MFDYKTVCEWERKWGSSFYIFDPEKLRENYRKLETAFKSRYEPFIIGYSYKTNYLPYLCKELSKLGAYAEVVSRLEYDLAVKIGVEPTKIIFNGPMKTRDDYFYALDNESMVNVDSYYEIKFIKEYALNHPSRKVKLGLRVNFDLSLGGDISLQGDYQVSRFGICTENGSLQDVLQELTSIHNVQIVGLHGHFSTKNRSVETYQMITRKLCELAKTYVADHLEYIDIGGGIYGELPPSFNVEVPTFDDYADAICQIMNNEFNESARKPSLILEPGNALSANTFVFIAKVVESKTIRSQHFVLVDGSVHNIKPTMHKYNLPMKWISQNENYGAERVYHIVGYTCMEKDYLAHEIRGPVPERDDYILFENVGAYTIVFNPPFIKERPAIIAIDKTKIFPVRNKETFKQFFNDDIYYL